MDLIKKCMTVVAKAAEEGKRVISFIGSTADRDRDDEVIEPSGWDIKRYKENPVFLWGHNHGNPPIGRTVRVRKDKEDGKLLFDVEFPTEDIYPFADTIYKLYKNGYLNAVSVGFMPIEWKEGDPEKKEPRRTYIKTELLELSGVTVPSNYNALVSARAAGTINDGEFVKMKAILEGDDLHIVNIIKEGKHEEAEEKGEEKQVPGEGCAEDAGKQGNEAEVDSIPPYRTIEIINTTDKNVASVLDNMASAITRIEKGLDVIAKILGVQSILKDDLRDAAQSGQEDAVDNVPESSDKSYFDELFSEANKINKTISVDKDDISELLKKARELRGK